MSMGTPVAPRAGLLMGQVGTKQFHNQPEHWACLAGVLRAADLSARFITDDLDCLRPDALAQLDVFLNFSTGLQASEERIQALATAVASGLGYIGLHAATTTFRGSATYHSVMGSWFVRHPPFGAVTVEPYGPPHPVTAGLAAFTIEDERYELEEMLEDITVLARADGHPMVYVRRHGLGRVCYIALGHDQRSLSRPEYAQLVHQAIAWTARPAATA